MAYSIKGDLDVQRLITSVGYDNKTNSSTVVTGTAVSINLASGSRDFTVNITSASTGDVTISAPTGVPSTASSIRLTLVNSGGSSRNVVLNNIYTGIDSSPYGTIAVDSGSTRVLELFKSGSTWSVAVDTDNTESAPVTINVNKTGHGLSVMDIANTQGDKLNFVTLNSRDTKTYGVVSKVIDANNVVLTLSGKLETVSLGYTPVVSAGNVYVDATGNVTQTPTQSSQLYFIGYPIDGSHIYVAGPIALEQSSIQRYSVNVTASTASTNLNMRVNSHALVTASTTATTLTHTGTIDSGTLKIIQLYSTNAAGTTFSFDSKYKGRDGNTLSDIFVAQNKRVMVGFYTESTSMSLAFTSEKEVSAPTVLTITKTNHGLSVLDVANTLGQKLSKNFSQTRDEKAYGLVSKVIDVNTLELTLDGLVTASHAFSASGGRIFSTPSGGLTQSPSESSQVYYVGYVVDSNSIYVDAPISLEQSSIQQPSRTIVAGSATTDIDSTLNSHIILSATTANTNVTHTASVPTQRLRVLQLYTTNAAGTTFSFDAKFVGKNGSTLSDITLAQYETAMVGFVGGALDKLFEVFSTESSGGGSTTFATVNDVTARDLITGMKAGDLVATLWPPTIWRYTGSAWNAMDDSESRVNSKAFTDADIPNNAINTSTLGHYVSLVVTTPGQTRTIGKPGNGYGVEDDLIFKLVSIQTGTTTLIFDSSFKDAHGKPLGTVTVDGSFLVHNTWEFRRDNDLNNTAFILVGGTEFTKAAVALDEVKNQVAHGFTVSTVVYHDGTSWKKAKGDASTTVAQAIVSKVVDTDNFVVSYSGVVEIPSHGLTIGEYYWLDQTTAGSITSTQPTSGIQQSILHVRDANTLLVDIGQAVQLTGTTSTALSKTTGQATSDVSGAEADIPGTSVTVPNSGDYLVVVNARINIDNASGGTSGYVHATDAANNPLPNSRVQFSGTNQINAEQFSGSSGYHTFVAGDVVKLRGSTSGSVSHKIVATDTRIELIQLPSETVVPASSTTVNDQASSNYFDVGTMRMQWGVSPGFSPAGTINFPVPFGAVPVVTLANAGSSASLSEFARLNGVPTTTSFPVYTFGGPDAIYWIAIGLKP